MRLLGIVAAAGLLAAGARAEEKKADYAKLIIGKWEVTKADDGTGVPVGAAVEFTKDGKMKFTAKLGDQEMTFEGTYKVDQDSFTMTHKQGDQERSQKILIKKLDEKTLSTADDQDRVVELTRKK